MADPRRGEIWLANLNPTRGREQTGRRPVLVRRKTLIRLHDGHLVGRAFKSTVHPTNATITTSDTMTHRIETPPPNIVFMLTGRSASCGPVNISRTGHDITARSAYHGAGLPITAPRPQVSRQTKSSTAGACRMFAPLAGSCTSTESSRGRCLPTAQDHVRRCARTGSSTRARDACRPEDKAYKWPVRSEGQALSALRLRRCPRFPLGRRQS